ncbi:MAG: alpha/beta hydrolase [Chitinophagaceae bacterium]
MSIKQVIYCISGLGADEKIFTNLELSGYELRFISWLRPHKGETIEAYAARMASSIKEKDAVLLGVSFGGMIGIEIARQKPLHRLILVSSIKSTEELPRWMKVAGKLKLNKLIPVRNYSFTEKIDNRRLGITNEEEKQMVTAYRKSADASYIEWAIHQVLNWKNDWTPSNIIHIHGDNDRIFPVKKIKATHIIKGATHMMVYNRAKEVSECIIKELNNRHS